MTVLREVRQAGFSGIELFQHPCGEGGAARVYRELEQHNLKCIGISSGSFEQRCAFAREYSALVRQEHPDGEIPYVYVDDWREGDRRFTDAVSEGLRLAIHPHMYKPVQTLKEAETLLDKYPEILFLPDSAHMTIAGDDPVAAIRQHTKRIDAVHLKDWRENVGRSYQFYARGFCELGHGDVRLEGVLNSLLHMGFSGWIVVELDWTTNPLASARQSMQWLQARLSRGQMGG